MKRRVQIAVPLLTAAALVLCADGQPGTSHAAPRQIVLTHSSGAAIVYVHPFRQATASQQDTPTIRSGFGSTALEVCFWLVFGGVMVLYAYSLGG